MQKVVEGVSEPSWSLAASATALRWSRDRTEIPDWSCGAVQLGRGLVDAFASFGSACPC